MMITGAPEVLRRCAGASRCPLEEPVPYDERGNSCVRRQAKRLKITVAPRPADGRRLFVCAINAFLLLSVQVVAQCNTSCRL